MSSTLPIVRQVSWKAAAFQVGLLLILIFIFSLIDPLKGALWGALVYLAYSQGVRSLIARSHRSGIRLFKQQRFQEAIPCFEKSLAFFDAHPWVDRCRAVVFLSPSAIQYREMALSNIAFCYSQLGDGEKARNYYEECLRRFPDSGLAIAAIRMMDSVKVQS